MSERFRALRETRRHWPVWLLAVCCVCALLAAGLASRAGAAPEASDAYQVQPGDTLEVVLWNDDSGPREVKVDAQGAIAYPGVGMLTVRGNTTAQIAQRLTEALRKQVKHPRVTVTLKSRRAAANVVYVLGAVARPGPVEWIEGMRVKDALGLAGGLAQNADTARGSLNNAERGTVPLDFAQLLRGDESLNRPLAAGDVLHVPARDFPGAGGLVTVFVMGQVSRPGPVQMASGSRVSDAVVAAGGPTPLAALRKATLSRKGEAQPVDLEAVLRGTDAASNTPLQEGDVILVPEARSQVTLVGEFTKPGTYPFREGDTITGAVALGGGPSESADLRRASLVRGGKEHPIDLHAMLKLGDLKGDQPLQDGDVLVLPTARHEVTLLGEFMKAGTYPFREGDTIAQAVALGGGPTPAADLQRAVLRRGGQEIPVDLHAIVKLGDLKGDRPLQDGDVLVVPPGTQILAYGAFNKPGPVVVTSGMKLVDVLLAAGGTLKEARLDRAMVVRNALGSPVRQKLDIKKALEKGGPGIDFTFQKGDVLYVPLRGEHLNAQSIASMIYMLTLAADRIFQ